MEAADRSLASPDLRPAAAPPADGAFDRRYRAWLLFLLTAVSALNLADRQGLAAITPALKRDLMLSDTQLGFIQGIAFVSFYAILAFPLARLADRSNRVRIVASCAAVFSVFLLVCSQARSFAHILLARIGVGGGIAGFGPPVSSLLGDHYPPQRRAGAITIMWLGAPIGAMIGAAGAGWVAQNYDWRWWFVGISVPAAILALLVFLTIREPERGLFDAAGSGRRKQPSMGAVFRFLTGKRSVVHVLIGAALAATGMNGIGQFLARYFVSAFELDMAGAGQLLGLIAVVSMASGLAIGGFGVGRFGARDPRWYVWGPAIGLLLATPLFLLAVTRPSLSSAIVPLLLAHVSLFIYFTPSLALAQNMVDSSMRASAAFIFSLVLNVLGVALGPTIVGSLSDLLAANAFTLGDYGTMCPAGMAPAGSAASLVEACHAASTAGVTRALGAASLLFAWAAVHYWLAARHVTSDLDRHYQAER